MRELRLLLGTTHFKARLISHLIVKLVLYVNGEKESYC
jgi:hypothetical protein